MNIPSIEHFSWWVEERERIRTKKEGGVPHPLTEDPIMQKYRFCNVFREDDTVSRWLATNIWNQPLDWKLLANTVLHRAISRVDSSERVGYLSEPQHAIETYAKVKEENGGWGFLTSSFRVPMGPQHWPRFCQEVFDQSKMEQLLESIRLNNSLEYTCLRALPRIYMVGHFLRWQITADLTRTAVLAEAPDRGIWCEPGPGAQLGLKDLGKSRDLAGVLQVVSEHNQISEVKLDATSAQHCLCEYGKYLNAHFNRIKLRRRYR